MKSANVDPLEECLHALDILESNNPESDKHTKGMIILVHGSPCEGQTIIININLLIYFSPLCFKIHVIEQKEYAFTCSKLPQSKKMAS